MYFPNGTSGEIFREQWCYGCANYRERKWVPEEGEGCAIFDAHFLSASEVLGQWPHDPVLDFLIDETLDPPCRLYLPEKPEDKLRVGWSEKK